MLKQRLKKEIFQPTWLGAFTSHIFLSRFYLYKKIKILSKHVSGAVLDLGCGEKPYQNLFSSKKYIGLEINGANVDKEDINLYYYDGKKIPFEDSTFDSVVSFETLEHIFDIENTILEIKRVLKDKGKLLISIPFGWNEHMQPQDFARYTSFAIEYLLTCKKFKVIEIHKTNSIITASFQIIIAYLHQNYQPKIKIFARLFQFFFIAPITLLAIILEKLLKKDQSFFSNIVVLAENNK
jgi:SAM-dependent methyltransferase